MHIVHLFEKHLNHCKRCKVTKYFWKSQALGHLFYFPVSHQGQTLLWHWVSLVSWVMSVIKLLGIERGFWVHIINRYIYLFIIWALLSSEIVNDTRDTWHSRHWLGKECLRVKIFYGRFLAIDSLTATEMLYLCNSKSIVRWAPVQLRETRPQS